MTELNVNDDERDFEDLVTMAELDGTELHRNQKDFKYLFGD